MRQVHPVAQTTPRTRAEMRTSEDSSAALAKRYKVSFATARKWKGRDDSQDRSHRPHTLATTLSAAQKLIVVELRRMLLLPLDDLLAVIREFSHPDVSRSGLDRCLRRHKVSKLKSLQPEIQGEIKPLKTFKDNAPGFLHVDIKYLPQMPGETQRRYPFVAVDRATRGTTCAATETKGETSSVDSHCP